jgi:tetratricopeptide (TPR) repeat protein
MDRKVFVFFLLAGGLFVLLFWVFDTISPDQKKEEGKRALDFVTTDIINIQQDAKERLETQSRNVIESLEFTELSVSTDSARINALKDLSSAWFQLKEPAIAGYYAEQVATIDSSDVAWSIAGTTYAYGLQLYAENKKIGYCAKKAVEAFENAISLNPQHVDHRTKLAVLYADYPPADNPMKGILMLRALQETFPEDSGVLIQLARFGIQTGQYEKAAQRLHQVLQIDPEEKRAICMLAEVYQNLNKQEEAEKYRLLCE